MEERVGQGREEEVVALTLEPPVTVVVLVVAQAHGVVGKQQVLLGRVMKVGGDLVILVAEVELVLQG